MSYTSPPQIAARLKVRVANVLGWISSGELRASNVAASPRGRRPRWRISEADLAEFLAQRSPAATGRKKPRKRRKSPDVEEFY